MAKYKLTGQIISYIEMEVEAENLEEAFQECDNNYFFDIIDPYSPIIKDNVELTDKDNNSICLDDIDSNGWDKI